MSGDRCLRTWPNELLADRADCSRSVNPPSVGGVHYAASKRSVQTPKASRSILFYVAGFFRTHFLHVPVSGVLLDPSREIGVYANSVSFHLAQVTSASGQSIRHRQRAKWGAEPPGSNRPCFGRSIYRRAILKPAVEIACCIPVCSSLNGRPGKTRSGRRAQQASRARFPVE